MSDTETIPSPAAAGRLLSGVTLYGTSLLGPVAAKALRSGTVGVTRSFSVDFKPHDPLNKGNISFAVIAAYGYSFDGRCIRFDQVHVMMFATGQPDGTAIAAGQNACGFAAPYRMWDVALTDDVLDLSAQAGTFEKVVLETGRGGRRPPNTYRSELFLANRPVRTNE